MIIDNKQKFKIQETSSSNNINKKIRQENEQKGDNKKIKQGNKNINNDINNNIKIRASIMKREQKGIQEKISLIQVQEIKINHIEETLNQVKKIYTEAITNEKQEEVQQKIKIRELSKQSDPTKYEYDDSNTNIDSDYLKDKEKIIKTIKYTLGKINNIKNDLSQYKSKLISLEEDMKRCEFEIQGNESYIKDQIIINPIDFVFIQGDLKTGIIINILV